MTKIRARRHHIRHFPLAGVPIRSEQRRADAPLVVAGGHCAFNPEPMADFVDAFVIGFEKPEQIDEMYRIMALANYEDRFVIPTAHRELGADAYDLRGSCGFSFGNGCAGGTTELNLFGAPKKMKTPTEVV